MRDRVARRPLTAFLALLFGVGWPLASVPALTAHGVLPGGPLPQEPFALGTTLLVMLPAALWVTAVADGPGAVRALLRRAVRWRFGAGWWVAVLLALPVLTLVPITRDLLETAADLGPPSLRSLDALHLATALSLGSALDAFVVYDERLAQAAADAGLPVVAPS